MSVGHFLSSASLSFLCTYLLSLMFHLKCHRWSTSISPTHLSEHLKKSTGFVFQDKPEDNLFLLQFLWWKFYFLNNKNISDLFSSARKWWQSTSKVLFKKKKKKVWIVWGLKELASLKSLSHEHICYEVARPNDLRQRAALADFPVLRRFRELKEQF